MSEYATLTGRLVHPYNTGQELQANGTAVLSLGTTGAVGDAVHGPDVFEVEVRGGSLVGEVRLAPGVWSLVFTPECKEAWPRLQVPVAPGAGSVDLKDVTPVAEVDGQELARGPAGRGIDHVTDPNSAGKATIVFTDGTSQPWDLSALTAANTYSPSAYPQG